MSKIELFADGRHYPHRFHALEGIITMFTQEFGLPYGRQTIISLQALCLRFDWHMRSFIDDGGTCLMVSGLCKAR
jgi:hypothetical protein